MDQHMTYDKERLLKQGYAESPNTDEKTQSKKTGGFIWSYIIKPVRKGYVKD